MDIMDTSPREKGYDTGVKELKSPEDTPKNKSFPLSPVMKNSKSTQRSAFHWKKFSNVSSSNLKIQSAAAACTFRTVFPKDKHQSLSQEQLDTSQDEMLSLDENCLGQGKKLEESNSCLLTSSQASLCSDVDSIDNESFGLTSSLPSSLESSEVIPLKDSTNCPSESYFFVSCKNQSVNQVSYTNQPVLTCS